MSLENVLVQQLPTELLLAELKRRGVEPCIVPGIEQAPDLFVFETLVGRLTDHKLSLPAGRARQLLGLLHHHYPNVVTKYCRIEVLSDIDDTTLWETIADKDAILCDRVSDDALWEAMSPNSQQNKRVSGSYFKEVLQGLRENLVSAVDDAIDELEGGEG